MKNTGVLFANDSNKDRCKAIVGNFHRLGIINSIITNLDGRKFQKVYFSQILGYGIHTDCLRKFVWFCWWVALGTQFNIVLQPYSPMNEVDTVLQEYSSGKKRFSSGLATNHWHQCNHGHLALAN